MRELETLEIRGSSRDSHTKLAAVIIRNFERDSFKVPETRFKVVAYNDVYP